ncbi:hypothetical protein C7449_103533 [Mycoplana dimorpha]|uniref:Uncharacterized protein n=1 Tax=Mycoplana dimorpha TaxID=28320 RepID=A0A2T5BC04_MYCDI|nr:hypothetical protein C7449_103533 [Mycoplana dimorpha]
MPNPKAKPAAEEGKVAVATKCSVKFHGNRYILEGPGAMARRLIVQKASMLTLTAARPKLPRGGEACQNRAFRTPWHGQSGRCFGRRR